MSELKSKGGLFNNDNRASDKHPHLTGSIEITSDQIAKLIEMGKAGQKVQLRLAGWKNKSQAGNDYVSLAAEAYMKPTNDAPF